MENLSGEIKKYAEACTRIDAGRLKVLLSMRRKPRYWNLSTEEAATAIRAAIEAKRKMAG